MELKDYFKIVDISTIPEKPPRENKYRDVIERAKKLEGTQTIRIVETKEISLPSISSLMYKLKLKVTKRVENKKNVLYISLKTA